MKEVYSLYKLGLAGIFLLFGTFTLGLIRALIDSGKINVEMPQGFLYFHIAFALASGILSLFLLVLANKTGLLFPRFLAITNIASISIAGINGILYLLTNNDLFTDIMLYSFEIAFGVSSMLIGYLYCFYRNCFK
ncbi:hypothetical protein DFR86_11125 [Acidianus sulfidivorans JP7]|uniref:Uncharacterized protein n=1 Tax=Acidianus sulfidivorans JP7 TaxID=619593 RepID=A0A2U9IPU0_9CREN|nr:hypothetical protein [Acidianus sulfidivorans]AWR98031.1 hypothetical protein DFR86_11125 [Acidianus sulfidivorans JP7]